MSASSTPPKGSDGGRPDQNLLTGTLHQLGRAVSWALPGIHGAKSRVAAAAPGMAPGIESFTDRDQAPEPDKVRVRVVDYAPERVETIEVGQIESFLARPRPEWVKVRWIDVGGTSPYVMERLRRAYAFHTLAAEDVLRVPQRPKMEPYEGCAFVVLQRLQQAREHIQTEQVSLLLFADALLTFHETPEEPWAAIRARLDKEGSRLRSHGADYMLYALLDALVDQSFPVLEDFGEYLEELEERIIECADAQAQRRVHATKRDLIHLRRLVWPVRELMSSLLREEALPITHEVRTYLRDVYDHAIQVMDIIETYREMVASLNDLYMSAVSNRMNEVMKVLTLMASFFIPITFVAGVYGMNFEFIPELAWPYSYGIFWLVCLSIVAGLVIYFRRKGWLGGGPE